MLLGSAAGRLRGFEAARHPGCTKDHNIEYRRSARSKKAGNAANACRDILGNRLLLDPS